MTKNDQKLIIKWGVKMWSNLTTKRGDSGSACFLERKCVITEAPKFDTKRDKNWSSTWKINKNDQNSTKSKNSKNEKNQKSSKMTKIRKCKIDKSDKTEKWKSEKNIKNWPPPEKGQNVT